MLDGFKDFLMRGNLIELAVAFIMAAAFGTVVTAFTAVFMEALTKLGGVPNYNEWAPLGFKTVGPFLTALVSFLLMAFVVYFFIVRPYEAFNKKEDAGPTAEEQQIQLLEEIRDSIRTQ